MNTDFHSDLGSVWIMSIWMRMDQVLHYRSSLKILQSYTYSSTNLRDIQKHRSSPLSQYLHIPRRDNHTAANSCYASEQQEYRVVSPRSHHASRTPN